MARNYIIQKKTTGSYCFYHDFGDGDRVYLWTSIIADAHHFRSRKEAKDTLRAMHPPQSVKDYTFLPVTVETI